MKFYYVDIFSPCVKTKINNSLGENMKKIQVLFEIFRIFFLFYVPLFVLISPLAVLFLLSFKLGVHKGTARPLIVHGRLQNNRIYRGCL